MDNFMDNFNEELFRREVEKRVENHAKCRHYKLRDLQVIII